MHVNKKKERKKIGKFNNVKLVLRKETEIL